MAIEQLAEGEPASKCTGESCTAQDPFFIAFLEWHKVAHCAHAMLECASGLYILGIWFSSHELKATVIRLCP